MTTARDQLSKADTITIAAIAASLPALIQARNLIDRFQTMIRRKARTELDQWIADARDSLFAPFANGILKDKAAVSAPSQNHGRTAKSKRGEFWMLIDSLLLQVLSSKGLA
ncbi:hypothetical protein ACC697_37440 [Rhizobium ruizarguesonis]